MSFELGHKKFGGRKAGEPNKSTREFRALLGAFVEKEVEGLPQTFNAIKSPERRVELILKLLPFVVPKVQENTLEMLSDGTLDYLVETLLLFGMRFFSASKFILSFLLKSNFFLSSFLFSVSLVSLPIND